MKKCANHDFAFHIKKMSTMMVFCSNEFGRLRVGDRFETFSGRWPPGWAGDFLWPSGLCTAENIETLRADLRDSQRE
jgi:hypothetical protein